VDLKTSRDNAFDQPRRLSPPRSGADIPA